MLDPAAFVEEAIESVKSLVDGKAVIGASGGVDSSVAAVIAAEALGDDLRAVFVDTGYLRLGEPENVCAMLRRMGVNLHFAEAGPRFYKALEGIIEPETKRKIIGGTFIEVFEEEAQKWGAEYLLQGTIAPDWIESGGGLRDVIKSHHNVGGLPEKMGLKLVEPLRDLYKDEVRQVADHMGIEVAQKQPFPGPGLAIRILGEATPERAETVRIACAIVEEELEAAAEKGEMEIPWQYFAVLLPVRSVGVHGDIRAYGDTIGVRAVGSLDGMTANAAEVPWPVLDKISRRITNKLKDRINRVVYDITHKPPGTIEWE